MPPVLPVTSNDAAVLPPIASRAEFEEQMTALRDQEKELTRHSDAVAAARRRLPMVPIDSTLQLIGPAGPVTLLDAFEGRRQLIAYYHMWHEGRPAGEQCQGCTWNNSQVAERSYLHSRDITFAVLCQGPYDESSRYRDFMGWDMPWYSAQPSLDTLLSGRQIGRMHIVCYVRQGEDVYETYWTTGRGVEVQDLSYSLMDLTTWGRQEEGEDSPPGWPQHWPVDGTHICTDGRPTPQWSRIEAGYSDDLTGSRR